MEPKSLNQRTSELPFYQLKKLILTMGEEIRNTKPVALPRGPKPEHFDGSISSTVLKFIDKYECLANFYSWSDEDKLQRVGFYLEDSALSWYKIEKIS